MHAFHELMIMTSQVENLRQTYDRTLDNLMTNRKVFFVIWPQTNITSHMWPVGSKRGRPAVYCSLFHKTNTSSLFVYRTVA